MLRACWIRQQLIILKMSLDVYHGWRVDMPTIKSPMLLLIVWIMVPLLFLVHMATYSENLVCFVDIFEIIYNNWNYLYACVFKNKVVSQRRVMLHGSVILSHCKYVIRDGLNSWMFLHIKILNRIIMKVLLGLSHTWMNAMPIMNMSSSQLLLLYKDMKPTPVNGIMIVRMRILLLRSSFSAWCINNIKNCFFQGWPWGTILNLIY